MDGRLRPVADTDRAFLVDLYASIREPELAHVPWDAAAKRSVEYRPPGS